MTRTKLLDILGDAFSIAQAFLELLHTLNDKEEDEPDDDEKE